MLAQASIHCAAGARCINAGTRSTMDAGLRQHDLAQEPRAPNPNSLDPRAQVPIAGNGPRRPNAARALCEERI